MTGKTGGDRNGAEETAALFTAGTREILGDNLTGVYLHGSAAMGCRNPAKSDLDLIVVVRERPNEARMRALLDMTAELHASMPGKNGHSGIEMSVVTEGVCRPFTYPTPFETHFSAAHAERYRRDPEEYIRTMRGTDRDLAAHFTVILRRGVRLYGPPAGEVFGEVPAEDYLDSVLGDIACAPEETAADTAYRTLNLARTLAYMTDGSVLSKEEGGEWALARLPARFGPLLRAALRDYRTEEEVRYDPGQAEEYAEYMSGRIREYRNAGPEKNAPGTAGGNPFSGSGIP